MRKLFVFNLFLVISTLVIVLSGCSQTTISGPVEVTLIRPTEQHCGYTIAPTKLETLHDLNELRGAVGRVVSADMNLAQNPQVLQTGDGFKIPDLQFTKSGNAYGPVDMTTLFSASLYYAIETGYLLFKSLDSRADLSMIVPNLADTYIINDAKTSDTVGRETVEVQDNAEYIPQQILAGGNQYILNYFLSYPTKNVKDIPLGVNLGIMVHEFTHMVFQHLFYQPGIRRGMQVTSTTQKPTENTLAALDEGLADYFGFLATKDPGYFLCSFPTENRDLRVPKEFTDAVVAPIESGTSFDSHEAGAVFAAIQYQIGQAIGSHEENAKALVGFMSTLLDCADVNTGANSISMSFASVARCHERQFTDSTRASTVHTIYQQYLGNRYRGQ